LITALILASMTACETMQPGDPLIPVGEETPGPGLFSGESGEFKYGSEASQPANENPEPKQEVEDLDLQQTSEMLDQKIKELEQQRIELELLKLQVDKKLQE